MSTANMDPDMLDLLSPEERAAIEEAEHTPEELAAMKAIAGEGEGGETDDDKEDQDDEDDDDPDAGGDPAAAADPAKKDEPAADDAAAGADKDEPAAEFRPHYQAELPEDYNQRVAAMKEQRDALVKQFKDGEIDFDAYNVKLDELNAERDVLNEIRTKASISTEMNQQSLEQQWNHTVRSFAAQVSKEVDYSQDAAKQQDLDAFVKALANNPANNDRPMRWFLDEAHRRVKALHGIGTAKPQADGGEKPAAKDPKQSRKPPVEAAPKNLSQVPGSDGPGDLAGEFAALDNLEGMELETALAKMSPEQRDRYARGG